MGEKRVTVWIQRFKDRPQLMLQWLDPETGRRKSRSAGTADVEVAERKRADLEYELTHGKYQEAARMDWEHFRELFEDEYLPGVRMRTREKYLTVLDVFEGVVHPTKLRQITERTISAFVKGLRERKKRNGQVGLAPMTIKNYLIALRAVLSWGVKQRLLLQVPNFPVIKVPKKKPQPVSQADFDLLLKQAPDALWRAYLLCGWWGGLRLSEALHLSWQSNAVAPWLDWDRNRVVLPAEFVKAAEDQWIPLHSKLREALLGLPRSEDRVFPFRSVKTNAYLTRSGVTNRVLLIAKKAGVKLSMHRLRKGFGCRVAKQLGKGNAPVLHRLMRHSSMQITMDYYASVDDALDDVMTQLD